MTTQKSFLPIAYTSYRIHINTVLYVQVIICLLKVITQPAIDTHPHTYDVL